MILLLKLIAITTIWCLGIKILTADGMVLSKVGKFARKKIKEGQIIYEPLVSCEFCLPSIHSLVGYVFGVSIGVITGFSMSLVFMYPLVAMGSSIATGFIWNAYQTMMAAKDLSEVKIEFYDNFYEEEEAILTQFQNHN